MVKTKEQGIIDRYRYALRQITCPHAFVQMVDLEKLPWMTLPECPDRNNTFRNCTKFEKHKGTCWTRYDRKTNRQCK